MKRLIAVALAATLGAPARDFAILNLRVIEGEGMVYAIGSRATRGITIEVTDETGQPVSDVTVSFRLPEDGATGVFGTGGRTEIATTKADGRAAVWGMKWNRTPGAVQVRITAAKDGVRAGLVSTQHLTDSASLVRVSKGESRRGLSKTLLFAFAAAGAGGGIALGMVRSPKAAAAPATPTVQLSIGTPSVIVGAP